MRLVCFLWGVAALPACSTAHIGGDDVGGPDACATCEEDAAPVRPPWQPDPGTSWQWQLTGTIDMSYAVRMYDIDLFDAPQAVIDQLHSEQRKVICYFSAGTVEPGRPDAASFPAAAIGSAVGDKPDQRWLDVRNSDVRAALRGRLDRARDRGCDGVEPDRVDGFTASSGFPLTAEHQLDFNRFLADEAHARGLSIGLKNDLAQVPDLVASFDWAMAVDCLSPGTCAQAMPFVDNDKAVFHVEYGLSELSAETICSDSNTFGFETLVKHREVDAWRIPCRAD